MYKMTIQVTLENEAGVMATQTTTWEDMTRANMLLLEGSHLDWMASLPRTIGAGPVEARKGR